MSLGVTMKTIAAQAGVTQATVSMSLANNPRIPQGTRERIQAVAKQLGYQPNPYLSTLMRIRRQGKPLNDKPALALVCGDSVLWKPSEKTPLTAMATQKLFERALARFGDTKVAYSNTHFPLTQKTDLH